MHEKILCLELQLPGGSAAFVQIELLGEEVNGNPTFTYQVTKDGISQSIIIKLDKAEVLPKIETPFFAPASDDIICAVRCGLVILPPIVECWKKNGKFPDIVKCLKNKSGMIIGDIADCVKDCY